MKTTSLSPAQENVMTEIENEVTRAKELHPGEFHNAHEGYAVLLEEVRELENAVFFGKKLCAKQVDAINPENGKTETLRLHKEMMREEAIQIAAMAVRFASELC